MIKIYREPLLKICRVNDVHAAMLCSRLGVDWIGLHMPHRLVEAKIRRFAKISRALAIRRSACKCVLVTKIRSPEIVARIAKRTGIRWIQYHIPISRRLLVRTKCEFRKVGLDVCRFIGVAVAGTHPRIKPSTGSLLGLGVFIVDSAWRGGTGVRAPLAKVRATMAGLRGFRCLIAGGVSPANIGELQMSVMPNGFDIQSSLENASRGRPKDGVKLEELAKLVRPRRLTIAKDPGERFVALALTEQHATMAKVVFRRFKNVDIDRVHLDHSDGSLAPGFLSNPLDVAKELRLRWPCTQYDVHFFVHDLNELEDQVWNYRIRNPMLRAINLYIGYPAGIEPAMLERLSKVARRHKVRAGISLNARDVSVTLVPRIVADAVRARVFEILLVTHRSEKSNGIAVAHEKAILGEFCRTRRRHPRISVSVDREVSIEKLSLIATPGIGGVVMGRALLESSTPQITVNRARAVLADCE